MEEGWIEKTSWEAVGLVRWEVTLAVERRERARSRAHQEVEASVRPPRSSKIWKVNHHMLVFHLKLLKGSPCPWDDSRIPSSKPGSCGLSWCSTLQPQALFVLASGFFTGCFFWLNHSSGNFDREGSSFVFKPQLKRLLLRADFPDHRVEAGTHNIISLSTSWTPVSRP